MGFFDGFVWLQDADLRYAILNGRGVIGLGGGRGSVIWLVGAMLLPR